MDMPGRLHFDSFYPSCVMCSVVMPSAVLIALLTNMLT